MRISAVKKVNLSAQLVDAITNFVEEGLWEPGYKLPNELELANTFQVSRNIMREAMKILENFGILDSKVGIGTFVAQNALSNIHSMRFFDELKKNLSVEQILETRLIIEPDLAYYACLRGTEKEIQHLKDIVDGKEQAFEDNEQKFSLHMEIAKISKNELLFNFLGTIMDRLRKENYVEFDQHVDWQISGSSYAEHKGIVEAIERREPELAKKLMYEHLKRRIVQINSLYDETNK